MLKPDVVSYVEGNVSLSAMLADMRQVFEIERVPNNVNFRKSARLVERRMREVGLEDVERVEFPLDGQTRYGDLVMPWAWDCREGYVEIVDAAGVVERVADWAEHPFVVAMWSPSTSAHPAEAELVDGALADPAEARGKIVLVPGPSDWFGIKEVYRRFKNSGAVAMVVCGGARFVYPDDYHWENSYTDQRGWYPFGKLPTVPCLTVNYRTYRRLAELAARPEPARLRVSVKSRTYAGKTDILTGVIPGERDDEFVFLTHLYEPLLTDDATGAATLLEIARVLRRAIDQGVVPRPKRTVRFLAGWELYGFNAFYQTRRELAERTFAGVNLDATALPYWVHPTAMNFYLSAPSAPCFLDAWFLAAARERLARRLPLVRLETVMPRLHDDEFLSSSGFDMPMYWVLQNPGPFHHMEGLNVDRLYDEAALRAVAEMWATALPPVLSADSGATVTLATMSLERALAGMAKEVESFLMNGGAPDEMRERLAWLRGVEEGRLDSATAFARGSRKVRDAVAELKKRLASGTSERLRRLKTLFPKKCKRRPGPAERAAARIVPTPKVLGRIYCLPDVPDSEVPAKPPEFERVRAWMDGRRDLATCVRMAFQEETRRRPPESAFEAWTEYVQTLSRYGYFDLRTTP